MLFADATETDIGKWIIIAFLVVNGSIGIIGIFQLFATRREVDKIDERVSSLETNAPKDKEDLIAAGERRSFVIHNRINPLVENTAGIKAGQEAFVKSFDNFTEVMRANHEAQKQLIELMRDLYAERNK